MGTYVNIYYKKINELLLMLDNVNINDPSSVLLWFYRTLNCNVIFEYKEVSLYIYELLKNAGYKDSIDINEEYKLVRELSKSREDTDKNLLANSIISIILAKLKNSESLDLHQMSMISKFNEVYNKELTYKMMMENLHNSVGSKVTISIIRDNEFYIRTGILEDIIDYDTITFENSKIPFIGYNVGILKIALENGNVIYNNSNVLPSSDLVSFDSIKEIGIKTFGLNYVHITEKII